MTVDALAAAQSTFESLCGSVERLAEAGRTAEAIALAKIAAHHAWKRHPGVFARPRLEVTLARCAEGLPEALANAVAMPFLEMCLCTNFRRASAF